MSLYEYDLYLIRELDKGTLVNQIIESGFLQPIDEDEAYILGQINCFFREVINREVPSCPLCILKLEIDNNQLEQVLNSKAQLFISWLEAVCKQHDIAYAFIGGGSYAAYYEEARLNSEIVFKQVGHLIESGKLEIIHPVMFFSARIGQGRICNIANNSPFQIRQSPGVGCLLFLIEGDISSDNIEILDPGNIYNILLNYFKKNN
ncbi:MAG TPA: hypothetical protein VK203_25315 [Nostocaceae cyanobacterium]|nr:hypothetical protein [Nostocaceae cyanobacterium]